LSYKNRKSVYDKLVADGRLDDISEKLNAEFGKKEEPKKEKKGK